MGIPMGIPTGFLWEWDGNGNGNSIPTVTVSISNYLYYYIIMYFKIGIIWLTISRITRGYFSDI